MRYNSRAMSFFVQPLQSQWWWHMSKASSIPRHHPTPNLLSVCLLSLYPAVDCTWAWMARAGQAAAWALCSRERRRGGEKGGGCTDFNDMHSVNGHSLLRGQEEKGALSFSPLPSLSSVPLPPAPSLSISCPPPQLARGFVRRQMIPQMPQSSRPFQLHSPASPQVRGHHRASEWVSVATVAMAVERVAEAFCCCLVVKDSA